MPEVIGQGDYATEVIGAVALDWQERKTSVGHTQLNPDPPAKLPPIQAAIVPGLTSFHHVGAAGDLHGADVEALLGLGYGLINGLWQWLDLVAGADKYRYRPHVASEVGISFSECCAQPPNGIPWARVGVIDSLVTLFVEANSTGAAPWYCCINIRPARHLQKARASVDQPWLMEVT